MSSRRIRLAVVLMAAACLSACSSIRSVMDPGNVEYRKKYGDWPVLLTGYVSLVGAA